MAFHSSKLKIFEISHKIEFSLIIFASLFECFLLERSTFFVHLSMHSFILPFISMSDTGELMRSDAMERLGEVLSILKAVLEKHPMLNSTEIFTAARTLINGVKSESTHFFIFILDQWILNVLKTLAS